MSKIARILNLLRVKPKVSTGICGGITYGYGKLDTMGYWQYMLRIEYQSDDMEDFENVYP